MSKIFFISPNKIIHQLKVSCQITSVAEKILTHHIITNAANEADINVDISELQQAADSFRLINKLENINDTNLWLKKHHLSLDEFEELVNTTVLSSKLAQHLFTHEVEPFFIKHQIDYIEVFMYEIVLENQDLAMELFYALTEGELSFSEVALEYIKDKELRRKGGYRGKLYRKDLKPEISAAVFAATPPQILEPIVTSKGVHLIVVEELVQPQLDETFRNQILSILFSEWLKQQIEQFEVKIDLDFLTQGDKPTDVFAAAKLT